MQVDEERTPDDQVGPQIASGRDATVHECGPGRVLRRTPRLADHRAEAELTEHLRAAGYPVPEVFRIAPGEMEVERIDGPTMLDDLAAHPWRVDHHARTLARLHAQLHAITPPPGMRTHPAWGDHPPPEPAGSVLHQDLHPGNVICAAQGPVVIDWPNARRGPAEADIALTWLLVGAFEMEERPRPPGIAGVVDRVEARATPWIRRRFVATFVRASGLEQTTREVLAAVAEARLADRSVRPQEVPGIRALVAREAR